MSAKHISTNSNRNSFKKVLEKLNCRFCDSEEVIKKGYRYTKNRGKIQKYLCKDCKKYFIIKDNFFRMRNSQHKITLCLDLFYRGISTRKVQEHFQAFYPHNSSNVSIYNWIIKYSNIIHKYTDNLKVNCGNELEIDEMELKRKGKGNWFFDCIDTKTRYVVSSQFIKSRNLQDMKKVLINAKSKTEDRVDKITTDGLTVYPRILRGSFGLNKIKKKSKIKHTINKGSDKFNYVIERFHNSVRQKTVNFRGFHGSIDSAKSIMKGYEIFYNFIRKHQGINKCPYGLATDVKLKENNKWLELINMSSKS